MDMMMASLWLTDAEVFIGISIGTMIGTLMERWPLALDWHRHSIGWIGILEQTDRRSIIYK
jgi:hypothetical protein